VSRLWVRPAYLAKHPPIKDRHNLAKHHIIAVHQFWVSDAWISSRRKARRFPPLQPRTVQFAPRCTVQQRPLRGGVGRIRCCVLPRLYSITRPEFCADWLNLTIVLADSEHPPLPVPIWYGRPGAWRSRRCRRVLWTFAYQIPFAFRFARTRPLRGNTSALSVAGTRLTSLNSRHFLTQTLRPKSSQSMG